MIMNIKQRKIQIEPKTKLNFNIYVTNCLIYRREDSFSSSVRQFFLLVTATPLRENRSKTIQFFYTRFVPSLCSI